MIITTANKSDKAMEKRAELLTREIDGIFMKREKKSIPKIFNEQETDGVIVVERDTTKYYFMENEKPFFFHPSMAVLRINRIKQGDNDLMVQIADLQPGDSFLDCTLGLAADAIVASYIVGPKGKVVGLESEKIIGALVRDGLKSGYTDQREIEESMKRIEVEITNHYDYLKKLPDNSFDIVYFDPMFRVGLQRSIGINPLRNVANQNQIKEEAIIEAQRVAKRKVLLKENIKSPEFNRLGFTPKKRSSSVTIGEIRKT